MHEAQERLKKSIPPSVIIEPVEERESVIVLIISPVLKLIFESQTIKGQQETAKPWKKSQGYAAGQTSVGRGDFDQAIRSMREGKRRARPVRPLSKIFLDGSNAARPISRLVD